MRRRRSTEKQVVAILNEAEAGAPIRELRPGSLPAAAFAEEARSASRQHSLPGCWSDTTPACAASVAAGGADD